MSNSYNPPKDAGIVRRLFLGEIEDSTLVPFPKLEGDERETTNFVIDSVDRMLSGRDEFFRAQDVEAKQSEEYIQELREMGLFGLIIPEDYEGLGLGNTAYCKTVERISKYDASTSLTVAAHSSIGMKGLLLFGNDEQKKRYLPKLASGEMIAAFCLTESTSGSDASSIRTNAVRNEDGSFTLNGEKIWITNGTFADFFTVFARTEGEQGKITAFIVERSFPGVSNGPKEDKMGIRASSTATVRFDNVRVPKENILGEVGKGFKVAMSILNNGRTGLGAGCVGAMKKCIEHAAAQTSQRKQFGQAISNFGLVREKLSDMMIRCFVTESAVFLTSRMIDAGVKDYSVEGAICKIAGSENLWQVANDALQLAGGNGFMKEYPYEMVVRDSRINLIFEGTNEILRLYVALTGLKDAGSYLKEIGSSASSIFNDPIKGFGLLSSYAARKIGQITHLGRPSLDWVPPYLTPEKEIISVYTLRLARASEGLLKKYGKGIVERQLELKRITEITKDLYLGLATLARISGQNLPADDIKVTMTKAFIRDSKRRMNYNLRRLISNEDNEMHQVASYLLQEGKYPFNDL